jgi:hypothetical protein
MSWRHVMVFDEQGRLIALGGVAKASDFRKRESHVRFRDVEELL